MTQPTDTPSDTPKIEFPCAYPIKVLGRDQPDFHALILAVFDQHAPGFDREGIVVKVSRAGTFVSMTVTIEATGPNQLSAIHQDLMATGCVSMVI